MGRSARVDPIRLAAAEILLRWLEGDGDAENLVAHFERSNQNSSSPFDQQQRRRLRELVYSCVRLRGRYDWCIESMAPRAPDRRVRVVLWLGLHEITGLSTPDHAAVSQSVELIRYWGGNHAVGFVNSMLRRVTREGISAFFPSPQEDPLEYAVKWLSHPRWLVERWMERWPVEEVLALCEAGNRRPSLVLRCRPGQRDEVLAAARKLEWELEEGRFSADALVLKTAVGVPLVLRELPGPVVVQDESAQLVAPLLTADSPQRVLDLCAAPGGKAFHLTDLLENRALVVASDRSLHRMAAAGETLRRKGTLGLRLVTADGLAPPFPRGFFDAVLVDAPCTGTGVLARRHEARWRRSSRDLVKMPRLQRKLLHSAVDLCARGGIIVYSTCSLEPEENDEVVDAVLRERPGLVEVGVEGRADPRCIGGRRLRVLPHRHGGDGSFAAVLTVEEKSP